MTSRRMGVSGAWRGFAIFEPSIERAFDHPGRLAFPGVASADHLLVRRFFVIDRDRDGRAGGARPVGIGSDAYRVVVAAGHAGGVPLGQPTVVGQTGFGWCPSGSGDTTDQVDVNLLEA